MDTVIDNALLEAQARSVDVNTLLSLYEGELIGFRETRTLLEGIFSGFAAARDRDLDDEATKSVDD